MTFNTAHALILPLFDLTESNYRPIGSLTSHIAHVKVLAGMDMAASQLSVFLCRVGGPCGPKGN
jgi:hypothetical protein